jgi:uncharacterized protein GlcG (DUF336 family)
MKILLALLLSSAVCFGQQRSEKPLNPNTTDTYIKTSDNLTLKAAFEIAARATQSASSFDKNVSIAVLDASGTTLLLIKGDGVGPHNTEAARRKAFTALSTKTPTLVLLRNAESNVDTKNLNSLPELLLLSGGVPLWYKGNVIGSIGVAGGGSPENDDLIAKAASLTELGITSIK